jgi:nitrate reductase assembly molybdenum cofactor insertion protein NarJ
MFVLQRENGVVMDTAELTEMIDKFLAELGTQSIVDGDKARDQLLDLRSKCEALAFESIVNESEEEGSG